MCEENVYVKILAKNNLDYRLCWYRTIRICFARRCDAQRICVCVGLMAFHCIYTQQATRHNSEHIL